MNILIAPNETYVMPGLAMLNSLFAHNGGDMDVYMLQSGLSEKSKAKFKKCVSRHGSRLHIVEIPQGMFDDAYTSIHITKETYYRLMAHALLPASVDRILYLDLDIIVNGDLRSFYQSDFSQNPGEALYVVCEGPGVSQRMWNVYDNLGLPHDRLYFNSGVLLMNLTALRREVSPNLMPDYIRTHHDTLRFHDQDTLNALFYDRVIYADWHIYNQTILHIRSKEEARERRKSAAIIHYAGSSKPWQYNYCSWYFGLFWKYAVRAGFFGKYAATVFRRACWHIGNHFPRRNKTK